MKTIFRRNTAAAFILCLALFALCLIIGTSEQEFSVSCREGAHYAMAGDTLVSASVGRLELSGALCKTLPLPQKEPRAVSDGETAAVYCANGEKVYIIRNNELSELEISEKLCSVSISGDYLCVLSSEKGYFGSTAVYDAALSPFFKWCSGENLLCAAAVSADGETLAAACYDGENTIVHIMSTKDGSEKTAVLDGLTLALSFMQDSLLAVGETAAYSLTLAGRVRGDFTYPSPLRLWCAGSSALLLEVGSELVSLDSSCRCIAKTELSLPLAGLSTDGKSFLCFSALGANTVNERLNTLRTAECAGAVAALQYGKKTLLLYSGKIIMA